MIRSFLSLVPLVVLPAAAVAQLPASPYTLSGPCPGGQCRPVQAAATMVHNTVVNAAEVVRGVWVPPAQPWYPPLPATVPQTMPAAEAVVSLRPVFLRPFGITRVDVVFGQQTQARSLSRPLGGRFCR